MNKYSLGGISIIPSSSNDVTAILLSYLMGGFDYYRYVSSSPVDIDCFVPIFSTPFVLDSDVNLVQKSSFCNFSARTINIPYPVIGSLVVTFATGSSIGSAETILKNAGFFNCVGDYLIIPAGFSNDTIGNLYMVIAISKEEKTNAFTPFSSFFSNGVYNYIHFYDLNTINSYISEISNFLTL